MTTPNAIKRLSKYGQVIYKSGMNSYYIHRNGWAVAFTDQMGEAINFSSRKLNCSDERDMTDRSYWDNLTQAIHYSFGQGA